MASEAIVFWLCGLGVIGGCLIRMAAELHGVGLF